MKRFLISCLACALAGPLSAQQTAGTSSREGVQVPADTAQLDLRAFALSIVKNEGTDLARAERLLDWLSHNFKWLSTDYKQRTVKEIITRQGGTCFELATVYMGLVKMLGIRYRQVAEINIHPFSERRQRTAEDLVLKRGLAYSVFGAQHNDHRWVEIYDKESGKWIPADPSVGVIGLERWLKARVWFGNRWAIDTSITNDMIVPFAIFTTDSTRKMVENRSDFYLVACFDRLYDGKLSKLSSWRKWKEAIDHIGAKCKGAFEGKVNLHNYRQDIGQIASLYGKLRDEFRRSKQKTR